jgi:ubiquinol-cytochrome c reductase cytochrome b subunit
VHDAMGVVVFLFIFSAVVFFAPEMGGYFLESNNFLPANPLQTPPHIAPVWYFTAFYSMLRATTDVFTWVMILAIALAFVLWFTRAKPAMKWAVPVGIVAVVVAVLLRTFDAKFWGVVVMGGAVVMLFFLPWLDHSPVKSIRYRPTWHKYLYAIFFVDFVVLCYIGTEAPSDVKNLISQIGTVYYFGFFLAMPIWTKLGTFKTPPDRVTFHSH